MNQLENLGFTRVRSEDPSILVELPYATSDNFIGKIIYPPEADAYLRAPVVRSLIKAQRALLRKGFRIKVWDAYRPFSCQKELWAACPDERYVARPVEQNGKLLRGSIHNRGGAVDLTLVDENEKNVEMPCPFDEFSERAHRSYKKGTHTALFHRDLLEEVMEANDFVGFPNEWWHFDWKDANKFSLENLPLP